MGQLYEFASNHSLLVSGLICSWFLVIFYESRLKKLSLTQVNSSDAIKLINDGAKLIDIRSSDKFKTGHIVNSKNLPPGNINSKKLKAKDKDKVFLIICDNGNDSGKYANSLKEDGFNKIFSLKGGLDLWQNDNLPIVK
ncbi:MAG: hypothetical protein CBC38_02640 [Gammaproteobacteria bacterium TMED78]|mgnify:CR=1 FL=1|nr:MAG: hypothetical protein CBC38_02640 [Gammaproteobacteria bacterium TMED78]|tara:strand:+ start:5408 stop:5824 length:417 start_codon:yes stop_codon:yes gene_type:complete